MALLRLFGAASPQSKSLIRLILVSVRFGAGAQSQLLLVRNASALHRFRIMVLARFGTMQILPTNISSIANADGTSLVMERLSTSRIPFAVVAVVFAMNLAGQAASSARAMAILAFISVPVADDDSWHRFLFSAKAREVVAASRFGMPI